MNGNSMHSAIVDTETELSSVTPAITSQVVFLESLGSCEAGWKLTVVPALEQASGIIQNCVNGLFIRWVKVM